MLKYVLVAMLALSTVPALAQHKHGAKGPNGGPMEDVAGVHVELVTAGKTITVNVLDEDNKPIKTDGYTGSALISAGSQRETVKLEASGATLKGTSKDDIAGNSQVTVMIKTAAGKSGQARFAR